MKSKANTMSGRCSVLAVCIRNDNKQSALQNLTLSDLSALLHDGWPDPLLRLLIAKIIASPCSARPSEVEYFCAGSPNSDSNIQQ